MLHHPQLPLSLPPLPFPIYRCNTHPSIVESIKCTNNQCALTSFIRLTSLVLSLRWARRLSSVRRVPGLLLCTFKCRENVSFVPPWPHIPKIPSPVQRWRARPASFLFRKKMLTRCVVEFPWVLSVDPWADLFRICWVLWWEPGVPCWSHSSIAVHSMSRSLD